MRCDVWPHQLTLPHSSYYPPRSAKNSTRTPKNIFLRTKITNNWRFARVSPLMLMKVAARSNATNKHRRNLSNTATNAAADAEKRGYTLDYVASLFVV